MAPASGVQMDPLKAALGKLVTPPTMEVSPAWHAFFDVKQTKREVLPGEIGLATKETTPA